MYRIIFFKALSLGKDGEQLYGDAGDSYLDLDFRPMVAIFSPHMLFTRRGLFIFCSSGSDASVYLC